MYFYLVFDLANNYDNGISLVFHTDRTIYFNAGAFNYLDVGINLTNRQFVVLQAMACSDVYVSLTSQPNMFSGTGFYEFQFDWLWGTYYFNSIR